MKLNLTLTPLELSGYNNITPSKGHSLYNLDGVCDNNECVEILAENVINTIPHNDLYNVIKHWMSKLRKNGTIVIGGTDGRMLCWNFLYGGLNLETLNQILFGNGALDSHASLCSMDDVVEVLKEECQIINARLVGHLFFVKAVRR